MSYPQQFKSRLVKWEEERNDCVFKEKISGGLSLKKNIDEEDKSLNLPQENDPVQEKDGYLLTIGNDYTLVAKFTEEKPEERPDSANTQNDLEVEGFQNELNTEDSDSDNEGETDTKVIEESNLPMVVADFSNLTLYCRYLTGKQRVKAAPLVPDTSLFVKKTASGLFEIQDLDIIQKEIPNKKLTQEKNNLKTKQQPSVSELLDNLKENGRHDLQQPRFTGNQTTPKEEELGYREISDSGHVQPEIVSKNNIADDKEGLIESHQPFKLEEERERPIQLNKISQKENEHLESKLFANRQHNKEGDSFDQITVSQQNLGQITNLSDSINSKSFSAEGAVQPRLNEYRNEEIIVQKITKSFAERSIEIEKTIYDFNEKIFTEKTLGNKKKSNLDLPESLPKTEKVNKEKIEKPLVEKPKIRFKLKSPEKEILEKEIIKKSDKINLALYTPDGYKKSDEKKEIELSIRHQDINRIDELKFKASDKSNVRSEVVESQEIPELPQLTDSAHIESAIPKKMLEMFKDFEAKMKKNIS